MMKTTAGSSGASISLGKKLLYYAILALIPVLLLVAIEGMLRLFNVGNDLSLFRKSRVYSGYYELNDQIGKRYFSRLSPTDPAHDIFRMKKPANCFRIFVMGESTTAGFPYQPGLMFSRILQYRLQDAFPDRRIEVVNTGLAAINSYTHADFVDEIIAQHPDAVLIYAGHNEYYGTLGIASVEYGGKARWIKKLHLRLIRLRSYQMVQQGVNFILPLFTGKIYQQATLMERIAQGKTIVYGSEPWRAGVEQFRINITEVLEKYRRAGVRVMLSEEICNIRDLPPFKSIASAREPGAADLFEKARSLEEHGDYPAARNCYYAAKDRDAIPFRAPEAINEVTIELGKEFGAPVVPMKTYFEERSPHGLIGYNLILEHAHPNVDGYFIMADAFFTTMRREHFLSDRWDTTLIKPAEYYRANWGFTALDSLAAELKIKQIVAGWPFKTQTKINTFQETYVPASFEDSLAFDCVLREKQHIEDAHITLAKRDAAAGNNLSAFNEYLSLIKSYPYGVSLYKASLKYLEAAGAQQKILDLLLSMPDKDESLWAMGALGTLYQNMHMPDKAADYFNKALEMQKPGDTSLYALSGLYISYRELADTVRLDKIADRIRSLRPGFDFDLLATRAEDAPKLADQAFAEVKKGNVDRAITLLRKSLDLKESFAADFLLGRIYFEKKDLRALGYLEKAYAANAKDPTLLFDLAILNYVNKDLKQASKYLDEYRHVSPDAKQALQLAKLIEKRRTGMAK